MLHQLTLRVNFSFLSLQIVCGYLILYSSKNKTDNLNNSNYDTYHNDKILNMQHIYNKKRAEEIVHWFLTQIILIVLYIS